MPRGHVDPPDDKRCTALKADGYRCNAWRMRDEEGNLLTECAGHHGAARRAKAKAIAAGTYVPPRRKREVDPEAQLREEELAKLLAEQAAERALRATTPPDVPEELRGTHEYIKRILYTGPADGWDGHETMSSEEPPSGHEALVDSGGARFYWKLVTHEEAGRFLVHGIHAADVYERERELGRARNQRIAVLKKAIGRGGLANRRNYRWRQLHPDRAILADELDRLYAHQDEGIELPWDDAKADAITRRVVADALEKAAYPFGRDGD